MFTRKQENSDTANTSLGLGFPISFICFIFKKKIAEAPIPPHWLYSTEAALLFLVITAFCNQSLLQVWLRVCAYTLGT